MILSTAANPTLATKTSTSQGWGTRHPAPGKGRAGIRNPPDLCGHPAQRCDPMAEPVRREKNDFTGRKSAITISEKIKSASRMPRAAADWEPFQASTSNSGASSNHFGCITMGNMPSGNTKPDTKMNMTNQVQRTLLRYPVHVTMRPMIMSVSSSLPILLSERASALQAVSSPLMSP